MGATQRRRWAYRSWRFAALLAGTTTSSFAGSPSHRLEEVPAKQQEKLLQGTQQEPKIPVTISYQPALYWALPIYLADQRGYFDELGLDASFRTVCAISSLSLAFCFLFQRVGDVIALVCIHFRTICNALSFVK
mmetsp:Transcript_3941/g.7750  ORF Transcript_3941/g.7750 Transcript_3941/m.7750 type:complete len:134 (-) Transcript_3941:15-416(-)